MYLADLKNEPIIVSRKRALVSECMKKGTRQRIPFFMAPQCKLLQFLHHGSGNLDKLFFTQGFCRAERDVDAAGLEGQRSLFRKP